MADALVPSNWIPGVLVAVLAAGCGGSALPAGDPARPDIIVVSIDTLRADHLGAWGYERPTSPVIDALAARGVRYASAWSPSPWTLPSHATMLSGWLPDRHGAIEEDIPVRPSVPLLAESFSKAGYATGGAVTTLFVSERYGFARGLDWYEGFGSNSIGASLRKTTDAEDVFEAGRGWVQGLPEGKPAFLFLHVYDVHYNYDAPPPWNTKFDRAPEASDVRYRTYKHFEKTPVDEAQRVHQIAQYDEEIAYVDHQLGVLLSAWDRVGRDYVVVVTADHGEEFWERGSWGHAHTLFPEQLHVPLVVAGSGITAADHAHRVGLEDLAPTLAGLAGVAHPEGDGVDRSQELRGGAPVTRSGTSGPIGSTSRHRTLRRRWHEAPHDLYVDYRNGSRWLCDLSTDPGCAQRIDDTEREQALEAQLNRRAGAPWQITAPGQITTNGVILFEGRRMGARASLEAGAQFAVLPLDADVRFRIEGEVLGPFRAIGGERPTDQRIRFDGDAEVKALELSDDERAALEALGYMQDEEP